jgi:DNA replication and repair protein RecF
VLRGIAARNFRNLEPLRLEVREGRHLLLGPNGAGKTSLLEAIYLAATTRSFRTARPAEAIRHGERDFFLRLETGAGDRLELAAEGGERRRRKNGKAAELAGWLSTLPLVAWTGADLEVLIGAPASRRRLLDRGVIGRRPASLAVIAGYRQALEEKRGLLQQERFAAAELEPWNQLLATYGAELAAERQLFVAELSAALAELSARSELGLPPLSLSYKPSPAGALLGAEAFYSALAGAGRSEAAQRQPLVGSQRDEIEIRFGGQPLRQVASAGERKALSLLLSLAQGRVLEKQGKRPVYLLDDFDAELDRERRRRLWRLLGPGPEGPLQVFASSNRPEIWPASEVDFRWACESGRIALEGGS